MDLEIFTQPEIEKVIFCDLFYLKRRKDSELEILKKKWLKDLLFLNLNIEGGRSGKFLFFRSLNRDDYKRLFHSILNCADPAPKIVVEDYVLKINKFNSDASKFLTKEYSNIKYFNFVEEKYRILLFIRYVHYLYIITKIGQNSFEYLVLFSDMQPVECLASLYFAKKGIATISLQHGLYIEYGDLDTVNVVNYKVQPSKYFLAWGENTKSLIEKHNGHANVFICGKPDLLDVMVRDSSRLTKEILVVCDQEIFQNQNLELIKIASDFCSVNDGWNFKVRFHPHNNKAAYYKKFTNILETNDYAIGSTIVGISSSLLYELGSLGYNVLQFKTCINTINLNKDRQFENLEDFSTIIEDLRNEKSDFTDLIKYIGVESRQHYKGFFNSLSNNQIPIHVSQRSPLFTIIIPTYNSGLLIYKAITSLLLQKFKDFEVVIVDGLSNDHTIPSIIGLTGGDERFRIYSQKDTGIYDAMNIGLKKAKGMWLYFLGSDDEFYSPSTLHDVWDFINSRNINHGMIYGNVKVKGDVKWAKDGTIYDGEFTSKKIRTKNICHQAVFYHRESKLACGEYNLKYKLCADWDMNLRIWSQFGGVYIDKIIAYFHAGGTSTTGSDPEFGKDLKKKILEYFGEDN